MKEKYAGDYLGIAKKSWKILFGGLGARALKASEPNRCPPRRGNKSSEATLAYPQAPHSPMEVLCTDLRVPM